MRQRLPIPPGLDGDLWPYRNLGRTHALHHHTELELNLITRGAGIYLLANRKYEITRGDLLWLFPRQEHVLIEQTPDFEMWIAVFKPAVVRRIAADAEARVLREADPSGEHVRRLPVAVLARVDALCGEVAAERERAAAFNAGLAHLLATAWRRFLEAQQAAVKTETIHPAVEKAARAIRDEAAGTRLDDLARRCGLSASRLSRLFKQQTGVALVDFRNRQRIERFLRLYEGGKHVKLLDAALEAGFGSYPQFHRVFTRVIGCAPGAYRRGGATGRPNKAAN